MSINSLKSKIAIPYAKALFDYSVYDGILHLTTSDCKTLGEFLETYPEIIDFLNNPTVSFSDKNKVIDHVFNEALNSVTLNFLFILIIRNRFNLLGSIVKIYFQYVFEIALIEKIEIQSAIVFTNLQRNKLAKKLRTLTNAREVKLNMSTDSNLLGGFKIKIGSDSLDFTYKNYLLKLSKHLEVNIKI
mmetsp:Transcript_14903/g.22681  ORF Transcript_14903/g.22681 Transcript_14903/m.22681 type:complete len:188 (+) Transcript_14903:625-1188(+)